MTIALLASAGSSGGAGIVLTLQRYVPLERDDGIPWTQAQIEESDSPAGDWAVIDTIELSPIDADPANPASRDLTTSQATLDEGWYRVVWVDGNGGHSAPTPALQNATELAGGVRPSVREVATHIRVRTKIRGGGEIGTFVGGAHPTRPTAEQTEDAIDDAIDEVLGKVQYNPAEQAGTKFEERIRRAVALYAAISIELQYWPEQVRSNQSAASMMQARYESRVKALISEGETGEPQGEGGAGDSPADASWAFPPDHGGLIGWGTQW